MAGPRLSDELAIQAVEAFKEAGTKVAAAKLLGIPAGTYDNRYRTAVARGLDGSIPEPSPDGFEVKSRAVQYNADGEKTGQSVRFTQEAGPEFGVPDGHAVKGISAYLDADGRVKSQWVKTAAGYRSPEEIAQAFEGAFASFKPAARVTKPKDCDKDKLTVYPIADWHLGMFAYGKETGGPDWDLSVAKKELSNTFRELLDQSPPSGRALILGLGDLLHGDNSKNVTPAHNNPLDVDTRYSKCVETACDLFAQISQWVAEKHKTVDVVLKEGNHDTDTTVGLRCALRMYWRNDKRVSVDSSPNPFHFHRFGVNLIGGVHGDKIKLAELPLLMAALRKEDWAETSTRHWHTGHFHHLKMTEDKGVVVHQHRAPIPPDAFHAYNGYLSGRSMRAFTYHKTKGFRSLTEMEIQ